ncbi:hypothetical protein NFI96_028717 [Prochilodus magdalenae]|nr:hypothetical protein NFI96_028717 [Prochilodus magdalenae]
MVHNNAWPHVARVCRQFLENEGIDTIDWPTGSPDLNPIEHLWDVMLRSIRRHQAALQTVQELSDALVQIWEEIPRDTIRRLIRSMWRPYKLLSVSFQKDSSSPVVCHATGFYPKPVMISWKKNGEDLDEGVEIRETVPNQDGTFQKRSILTVSPEELDRNQYTCIIQHSSLEKEMVLQVSDRRVLSGSRI